MPLPRRFALVSLRPALLGALALGVGGCGRPAPQSFSARAVPTGAAVVDAGGADAGVPRAEPRKVEVKEVGMGTGLTFVAYTNYRIDEAGTHSAIARAIGEMRRLEGLLSEWREDSEVGRLNQSGGEWLTVGPETLEVIEKSLWTSRLSGGAFDITFQILSDLWKFGDARAAEPQVPKKTAVQAQKKHIDYRKVEIDEQRVRVGKNQRIGLGGIAKGYIVDRAVRILRESGLESFLVQAGGDLYGAGRKPDGSPWVSGIQDPRGAAGSFFAVIELEDHAFSTAGDYARSYVVDGKRYHHIIDPRSGFPATACRSVTIWAPDAFLADAVDDAVFILGPTRGLEIVESLDGVGAVIVDEKNQVTVSKRLEGKLRILSQPSDGI